MSATEAPFDFGQTELTKYEKRHFEFLRVSEASGLKVKITGIRCVADAMSPALVDRCPYRLIHPASNRLFRQPLESNDGGDRQPSSAS